MSSAYEALNNIVSIKQFDNGKASEIFDRVHSENELIVIKDDVPSAVILSTEEFVRLSEIAEDFYLYFEAQERMKKGSGKNDLSFEEVMQKYGITQKDLDDAEDVEIE